MGCISHKIRPARRGSDSDPPARPTTSVTATAFALEDEMAPMTSDEMSTYAALIAAAVCAIVVIARVFKPAVSNSTDRMMHGLIDRMRGPGGFDYVIVCCSNLSGERFWQQRLDTTVEAVTGHKSRVLCVHEDWEGGAGNGLGTLYAVVKAIALGRAKLGVELLNELAEGKSVALYHTAGKGTRLAPLPGAENNNKPAVKLPELVRTSKETATLTILEAVIRQTSILATRSKGRVAVFWGDQVFVPSTLQGVDSIPTHHADILAALGPMPSEEEWKARALHQYGLIATDAKGDALQVEKVQYQEAVKLLPADTKEVGASLGSFSVSAAMLRAMLQEFKAELDKREGQMDADPHFWMPCTLTEDTYVSVMKSKGTDEKQAAAHWSRMQALKERVLSQSPELRFFGANATGQDMFWWDYGRLSLYLENNLLATEESASARALRHFLGAQVRVQQSDLGPVTTEEGAVVLGCSFRGGHIGKNSVLVNVKAPFIDCDNCVLVNVSSLRPITGKSGVLYNVVDAETDGSLSCGDGAVRADVFIPEAANALPRLGPVDSKHIRVRSKLDIDGGKAWKVKVENNEMSFEEVHKVNKEVDVTAAQEEAAKLHKTVIDKLAPVQNT